MRRISVLLAVVLVAVPGVLLSGSAAHAGEIGLKAIEGRLGFVDIGEGSAGSTFMISGSADLGMLTPDLGLEVGVDFWTKGWDVGYYEWSWTNIGFVGNIRYNIQTDGSFRPYGFGGLAICYQKWDWDCGDFYGAGTWEADESGIEFGLNLGAGAEFGSGKGMTPVARVGYTTSGGADYLYVSGGLRFPIGE
ncbi:MAG: outer membrane beta-barrel protein [Candidatus Eisenbacteria sp.]|nr:outer membrane beta-barrel protein [Candidatus Eisenbacteria bacterium]